MKNFSIISYFGFNSAVEEGDKKNRKQKSKGQHKNEKYEKWMTSSCFSLIYPISGILGDLTNLIDVLGASSLIFEGSSEQPNKQQT